MDGQGTLTNITAKWFLISLFFLLFVDARQVKFWLETTFPPGQKHSIKQILMYIWPN